MVAEKEEKAVDRTEDSLTIDKGTSTPKHAEKVVEEEVEDSEDGGKPYIQKLTISSDATTVKMDTTPLWLKALKVMLAFLVLWGLDAAVYAVVLILTIETGDVILYVYFGIFVVLLLVLTFAVLYGMRFRDMEAESEARKLRQESGIHEDVRMRSMGGGGAVRAGAVAIAVKRTDSLQQPAVRANSKVSFATE